MLDDFGPDLLSRRRVLSGIAAIGAVGAIAPMARPSEDHETPSDPPPTPPATSTTGDDDRKRHRGDLVLNGQFSRIIDPDAGGPSSSSCDLVDDNGNQIGLFWSAAVASGGATTLFHTFQLPTGTLNGQGFGPLDEATFAVVGGTGAYKGASGQYIARQRPVAAGGDGTADFVFDLIKGKE